MGTRPSIRGRVRSYRIHGIWISSSSAIGFPQSLRRIILISSTERDSPAFIAMWRGPNMQPPRPYGRSKKGSYIRNSGFRLPIAPSALIQLRSSISPLPMIWSLVSSARVCPSSSHSFYRPPIKILADRPVGIRSLVEHCSTGRSLTARWLEKPRGRGGHTPYITNDIILGQELDPCSQPHGLAAAVKRLRNYTDTRRQRARLSGHSAEFF
jgi:hypothetical protein